MMQEAGEIEYRRNAANKLALEIGETAKYSQKCSRNPLLDCVVDVLPQIFHRCHAQVSRK